MTDRRGSDDVRLRRRAGDINENVSPYSGSAASHPNDDSTDNSQQRPSTGWEHAIRLAANLPSRRLSLSDGATIDRKSSSIRRQPSIWNALTDKHTRHRILSRQSSLLSDVEFQPDEVDTLTEEELWERCRSVRDIPMPMAAKRQRRNDLISAGTMNLSGYDVMKLKQNIRWQRRKEKFANFFNWFNLWSGAFKTIDGQFGMGVGSYFRFLKWLFFLNVFILVIIFGALVIPQLVLKPNSFLESVAAVDELNITLPTAKPELTNNTGKAETLTSKQIDYLQEAVDCTSEYQEQIVNLTQIASTLDQIANFLQGKGIPENTFLFYGHYYNKTYYESTGDPNAVYIMPVAYILTTGAYFIVSLILMVRNSAKGIKESFVDSESRYFQYSCKIFTAWDYCMTSDTACKQKHINLFRDFKLDMESERIKSERRNRSRWVKFKLFIVRCLVNAVVIVVLIGAGMAIFYINEKSREWSELSFDEYILLAIEYSPSLCITALNAVVPLLFIYIVQAEDYSPEFEIKITLIRTVFLRLSSLAVLIASLFGQIAGCDDSDYKCGNCGEIRCWETYVGQQFYKLALLDFLISIAVVLCYEFPRRKSVEYFKDNKFFQFVGLPEFDIPRSVLDLVYGQTLCWIGAFFCPLIPLITVLKLFITFYLKKVSLLRNFVSSARTYRASKTSSFFTIVLLVSFILTTVPIGYSIGKIPPSKSCGPFRIYSSEKHFMFSAIGNLIFSWPREIGVIFQWLGSVGFIAPLIIILLLAMYYYYIVSSANKRMIELLKDQLAMEGRDKRYLIDRVSAAMKAKYATSD